MKVTLHIGVHRTGTTALQKLLREQRDTLARYDIGYLGPDTLRRPGLQPGHNANDLLAATMDMADVFAGVIETRASHLVMSEENAIGTMEGNIRDSGLYPLVTVKLRRFLAMLPEQPGHLVLGLRDYAGYWASAHAMCLRVAETLPTFDAGAVVEGTGARGWVEFAGDLRGLLPEADITVWRHRRDPRAMAALLPVVLGDRIAAAELKSPDRLINTAPNVTVLAEWQAARAEAGGERPDPEVRKALNKRLSQVDGAPHDPFTDSQRRRLSAQFETDWARLVAGEVRGLRAFDPMSGVAA